MAQKNGFLDNSLPNHIRYGHEEMYYPIYGGYISLLF